VTPREFDRLARSLKRTLGSEHFFVKAGMTASAPRVCPVCGGSAVGGERFIGCDGRRGGGGICQTCFRAGRPFPDQLAR
jgi:hypothetical protein